MPKKIAALLFVCLCFLPLQARGGDDLAKLGKARLDAAAKAYKAWILGNDRHPANVYLLSVMWLNAELDMATKKEERITAYNGHLHRMKAWEKLCEEELRKSVIDVIQSFEREAEYWIAKERSAKK